MIRVSQQVFKRWARIVSQLSLDEAAEILQGLESDYLEDWIAVYYLGKQRSGAFDALARQDIFRVCKKWQVLSCQFIGGPTGIQTFTATLGTYVLDCLIRELHKRGLTAIYSVVYKVLKRGDRTLCLLA